ncbi:spermidine hydroxycinnamoyl transferase-like [Arachis stenosperma]|uniref:spermidine hydroxycinnamoyl transferase-like n=1 Tax=Arachis stenosperma TaxID=217475 RepID=UPI0025ABEE1C|nr:spermidine hydroxycinnamoyl transferase-like [Arachis stenosperma]
MVTILGTHTVIPKEETPKGLLWLSDNDQLWRWSHTPSIYVYKSKQNNNTVLVERMRDSLSEILVHYYPLAGRLNWTAGGRLELDCNAKGALLLEAESKKSMAEYGDFTPNQPGIKELIPTVDYSRQMNELPLFLAQVTKFHGGDGGFAVGILWSHPLGDGLAAIRFINSWAKLTRGAKLDPSELPFLDRSALKSTELLTPPRFDHREFKPLPLILGRTDNIEEQKKKTTFALLKLTSEHVQKLKKNAIVTENGNGNGNGNGTHNQSQRPYSRFEVISAHIWRCACKARNLEENQPTVVKFNVDIRNRMNPPLPQNYFGNALGPTVTPTCYLKEITSQPISYAAQKIREAVKKVSNHEFVKSQMDYVAGFENRWDLIRTPYLEKGEYRADVPFFGNPNIILGSWMSMPFYEADFGLGKPFYFGPAGVCPYDRAVIALMPDEDGDNGYAVVVYMHFQVEHMKDFIKYFWEDI